MRHASKTHKKHMSDLVRTARKINLPLIHLIELYASNREANQRHRLLNRFGETIDWNNVNVTRFFVSVPLVTPHGHDLHASIQIQSLATVKKLEDKYNLECPNDVKETITKALQMREARKGLTEALAEQAEAKTKS